MINSGEALVVNGEYNSFERRIIHLAVQSTDGVDSESFMDGDVKRIQLSLMLPMMQKLCLRKTALILLNN